MNLPLFDTPKTIEDHFNPQADIVLYQGDVSDFVVTVPDNSVSLIITSPPYNLGKEYEDRISIGKYQAYFNGVLPYRPLGKPVYQPTGREKISQMPEEWQNAAQRRLLEEKGKTCSRIFYEKLLETQT